MNRVINPNVLSLKPVIESVENYLKINLILIHESTDDYVFGRKIKSRIFWVWMTRVTVLLTLMRFVTTAFIRTHSARVLAMDFLYMLTDPVMAAFAVICILVVALAIAISITYMEMSHNIPLLEVMYRIKYKIIKFPLNKHNYRKLQANSNLILKGFLYPMHIFVFVLYVIIHLVLTSILYSTNEKTIVTTLSLFITNILIIITLDTIFTLCILGIILWFISVTYLKMKFNEINEKITKSFKSKDINLLMYSMKEHNYVEKMTRDVNQFLRANTFLLYYIATPGFLTSIYATHKQDTTFSGRIMVFFVAVGGTVFLFSLNFMSTWVSTAAHKPYRMLCSLMFTNIRITTKERLKLLSFIEKLSGPDTGFYCYDLFPMNNYEFYQYICISISNYFLVMNLF